MPKPMGYSQRMLMLALLLAAAPWELKTDDCDGKKDCVEIYSRATDGQGVKEVKAMGIVEAPPEKVFEFVTDYEHQVGNMPYVENIKVFSRSDEEVVFWAVADFPMVSRRDWVLRSKLERNLPGGIFRAAWSTCDVADAPAVKDGVVRLKLNVGSWTLEPLDGGRRTLATYQLLTDPGGSIPRFIANRANTTALPELFARVRKHAEVPAKLADAK